MSTSTSRKRALKKIEEEIEALRGSALTDYRRENGYVPVPGEGSLTPGIMFIGEAPGKKEAETGKPFCGRAGQILDELLDSIGVTRDEVYITSIAKDRPPKNRDPKPEEIALYAPFLDRQIEVLQPKVIATLGRFSMEYVMERYGLQDEIESIGLLHGRTFELPNLPTSKLVPLYHPAACIYRQKLKPTLLEDFQVLKELST